MRAIQSGPQQGSGQVRSTVPFDAFCQVAAYACGASAAVFSLAGAGAGRPTVVGVGGLGEGDAGLAELLAPLQQLVLDTRAPVAIMDTGHDPRTLGLPVTEHVGAYLGVPLHGGVDEVLGVLSVIDPLPRTWDRRHGTALEALATAALPAVPTPRQASQPPSFTARFRDAVDRGLIEVRYQPLVDLRTGALGGAEALARWVDVVDGPVAPSAFVPVAEQSGIVHDLGLHVLGLVVEDLAARAVAAAAVNVSPLQLGDPGFAAEVERLLARHTVHPRRLTVEITESLLVADHAGTALDNLRRLRRTGVTVALDDFGSGYSSLARLRELPVDIVKIDRSFVAGLPDAEHRALVRGVVDIAAVLGLVTVAEGVETEEQAQALREAGVGFAQGWLFAPALTVAELAAWERARGGEER